MIWAPTNEFRTRLSASNASTSPSLYRPRSLTTFLCASFFPSRVQKFAWKRKYFLSVLDLSVLATNLLLFEWIPKQIRVQKKLEIIINRNNTDYNNKKVRKVAHALTRTPVSDGTLVKGSMFRGKNHTILVNNIIAFMREYGLYSYSNCLQCLWIPTQPGWKYSISRSQGRHCTARGRLSKIDMVRMKELLAAIVLGIPQNSEV